MRHGNRIKKLGRTKAHRKATLQALSSALIQHKRITTTLAKAKALRPFVEPILNRAKDSSTASRRQAFRYLQDKEAVKTLYGEIAEAIGDRPGGYTRVVKLGQRGGDAAEMAIIELVDFNDVKPAGASTTKRKTRRSRRKASGPKAAAPAAAATEATPAPEPEAPEAEAPAAESDDLTKVWGIGPVFAKALAGKGIATFAALAEADLDTLRAAIGEGSKSADTSVNEETWADQARLAAAGDWDGLAAYIDSLKGGATPAPEAEASQKAEAVASDATNPDTTGNPQIPQTEAGADHPDAEQGAAAGTGEPPPEAGAENEGRSGDHR